MNRCTAVIIALAIGLSHVQSAEPAQQPADPVEAAKEASRQLQELRNKIRSNPEDSANYRLLIERLLEVPYEGEDWRRLWDSRMKEAIPVARAWVKAVPGDIDAHLKLAELLDAPAERLEIAAYVTQKWPDRVEGFELSARAYWGRGDPKRARELLERFLETHPDDPHAYRAVAYVYAQLGGVQYDQLLREWRTRFPQDEDAIIAWLQSREPAASRAISREELKQVLSDTLSGQLGDRVLGVLCDSLESHDLDVEAASCYERLLERGAQAGTGEDSAWDEGRTDLARASLAGVYARLGQPDRVHELLNSIADPAERLRASIGAAYQLAAYGSCRLALDLIAAAEPKKVDSEFRSSIADALVTCGEVDRLTDLALDWLKLGASNNEDRASSTPLPEVPRDYHWEGGSGQYYEISSHVEELVKAGRSGEIVSAIRDRLKHGPGAQGLQSLLARFLAESRDQVGLVDHLKAWAAAEPARPEPHLELAQVFQKQKRTAEAVAEYRKAMALESDGTSSAERLFRLLMENEQFDAARELGDQLIRSGSAVRGQNDGYRFLALLAVRHEQPEEARKYFEKYYYGGNDPLSRPGSIHYFEAEYLKVIRELEGIERVERVLDQNWRRRTEAGMAWRTFEEEAGDAMERIDAPERAVFWYKKVIDRDGPDQDILENMGSLYEKLHRIKEAEAAFIEAIRLDSASYSRNRLAELYNESGRYQRAIELLTDPAIGRRGSSQDVLLARAYLGAGRVEEAVSVLSSLVQREPDDYQAKYQLGLAYEKLGDWASAQAYYGGFLDDTLDIQMRYGQDADCECYCDVIEQRRDLNRRLTEGPPSQELRDDQEPREP
ncbi:MAG: tetratricopeptide repeat protein [Acidobacteriota bacterium]